MKKKNKDYLGKIEDKKESQAFLGLCVTCSLRYTCKKALTDSGIWHCNDYKEIIKNGGKDE
ncbi:MAG: hypothetical protein K8S23_07730 [Candidatus Cloacimonetes bacterium]|nr:hypothetical protein [Candidatus Cloacimonadota bacterium]